VPPGKSCWSRRRIQIRKKPQEHTNNSSLALTHNKFLNQKCQSGRFLPDKQDLPFPFLDRWFTSCPSFGVLSREVAPLGIKVTIIEPGGFRTDFAGSSTKLSEGHPEYDSTVGATARFQRAYNGKQPGDPKKAAQAIVRLTQEQKPPLRLLLGSDAYDGAEKNDLARLQEARAWKELSLSTDF